MEKFFIEVGKIIGTSSNHAWSQIYELIPSDDQKALKRGRLIISISLASQKELNLVETGKNIASRIEEAYYGFLENSCEDQLKKALEEVEKDNQEMLLEIGLVAILGNACFLTVLGKGKFFLRREGKAALLLKGVQEEIISTSGFLKDKDVFIFASSKAIEALGEDKLFFAIMKPSIVESSDFLLPIIHSQEEDGLSLTAVIGLTENQESKEAVNFEKIDKPAISLSQNTSEKIQKPKKTFSLKEKLQNLNLLGFKGSLKFRVRKSKQAFSQVSGGFLSGLSQKLNKRAVYLQTNEKKGFKRTYITVAIVLGIMLLVSVALGAGRGKSIDSLKGTTPKEALSLAQAKIEEADALLRLNPLKSKEILTEAKNLLEDIEEEKYNKQKQELLEKIEPLLAEVSKEYNADLEQVIDLELIKDQAKADKVLLEDGQLYILDSSKNSIYSLDPKTLKNSLAASGDYLSSAKGLAVSSNSFYTFNQEGIIEINRKSKQKKVVSQEEDQLFDFDKVGDLAYFGQAVYVLTQDQIYKYPIFDDLLGTGRAWFDEKQAFQPRQMMIDGSIWVLAENLRLFNNGEESNFSLKGYNGQIQITSIYADQALDLLFILDSKDKKIITFNKNGEYNSQYSYKTDDNLKQILVSKEESKIYLFSGSKVYKMDFKE